MKLLEFGHLPYWAGGMQSSGGANAIFQIAYHLSQKKDVKVSFGATDVYNEKMQYDDMVVYGWTKWTLIKFCLLHFILATKCLNYTLSFKRRFPDTVGFVHRLVLSIFHVYVTHRVKPDIIHLHNDPVFYSDLLCKYAKIVVTAHGIFGNDKSVVNYKFHNQYENYIIRNKNISLITFVTNAIKKEYENTRGSIIPANVVILNAYDNSKFFYQEKQSTDKLVLCTIASVSDRKGQTRVINGISLSGINCKYICVGNGTEEGINAIKKLAATKNVDLLYLGKKTPDEIREVLTQSDFMILPSSSEGFGLVYLEAMACGTPIILPKDLPIVQEEKIISSTNSILLEDCTEGSIANALKNINNSCFNRKNVSMSVEGYSWDTITEQYLNEMKKINPEE